jgi:hypothetical protein
MLEIKTKECVALLHLSRLIPQEIDRAIEKL